MQKGISTLVGVIIIVVVALVVFGGVFAYQYFAIKAQQNSQFFGSSQKTDQTQTAGWKTYTSDKYGFEIKYPDTSTLKQVSAPRVLAVDLPIAEVGMGTNIDGKSMEIAAVEQSSCLESYRVDPLSHDAVVINGIHFIKETGGEGAMGHGYRYIDYLAKNNNLCIEMLFTISSFNDLKIPEYNGGKAFVRYDLTKEEPLINQIVSSFKFTK